MDIWVVGTLNQLFTRDSYTKIKFSKKYLVVKLPSLWLVHFAVFVLFVLTMAFDGTDFLEITTRFNRYF